MNEVLTEDTKAIILLCGIFGNERSVTPLKLSEYSLLVRSLLNLGMRPANLLNTKSLIHAVAKDTGLDEQRLVTLLERGVQLAFAIEEWQSSGLWIISRSDEDYPVRLKKQLRGKTPPLLFGTGDRRLLCGGGLGIVGSRNVDQNGMDFTQNVAELCARHQLPVISGGARGVDQIAMQTALQAGGTSVGIVADNLLNKSLERTARQNIAAGRLVLMSPYHPKARFSVGAAMGRNKLIYAMADYGLVVSADYKKGGTWAGAQEELKRGNARPIFVRTTNNAPAGNKHLLDMGAIAWPSDIDENHFTPQLERLVADNQAVTCNQLPGLFDDISISNNDNQLNQVAVADTLTIDTKEKNNSNDIQDHPQKVAFPDAVYQAVLPIILNKLDQPCTSDELAMALNVHKTQLNAWLQEAVHENKIIKLTKPVRYQKVVVN